MTEDFIQESKADVLRNLDAQALAYAQDSFETLSRHDLGAALAGIPLGSSALLPTIKYEVCENLYRNFFTQKQFSLRPSLQKRALDFVRRGRWDAEAVAGLLAGPLFPVGKRFEALKNQFSIRTAPYRQQMDWGDQPILLAGFSNRSGPDWGRSGVLSLQKRVSLSPFVISSDRQKIAGLSWINASHFLRPSDLREANSKQTSAQACFKIPFMNFRVEAISSIRFVKQLSGMNLQVTATQRLLNELSPQLVILPDERLPLARAVASLCDSRKQRCLSVPETNDQILRRIPFWEAPLADEFCVFHPALKDFVSRAGVDADRIRIASNDDFSSTFKPTAAISNRRLVLFSCQSLAGEEKMISMLEEMARTSRQFQIVVRPHPTQSLFVLKRVYPNSPVSRTLNATEAIANADVIVTRSSMLAVEALRVGKRVIIFNPDGCPELLPLLKSSAAYWAKDASSLALALSKIFEKAQSTAREDVWTKGYESASLDQIMESLLLK